MPALAAHRFASLVFAAGLLGVGACASSTTPSGTAVPVPAAPSIDPRIGLRAGLFNAAEAAWNLRLLSATPPSAEFVGRINSDLAFTGTYAIQGSFSGIQIWDISNPRAPTLVRGYVCPASQSDVSVYRNLLFVSGEGLEGRLDCGTQGAREAVSPARLRGIRIFDISDVRNARYVANVQTCRGSHTHSVFESPSDRDNVYIYVSGSAPVRPAAELAGCVGAPRDPNTSMFRIEVVRVPLANPAQAAIVSSPRIFSDLAAPPTHGMSAADRATADAARARGEFVVEFAGEAFVLPSPVSRGMLDSIVRTRGGTGAATAADSAALRHGLAAMVAAMTGQEEGGPRTGPNQCHDITLFPAIGLAGGACEGYGFLLDIRDPVNPVRIAAASDSNFAYWHSATFNNAGTRILFSDEWGGGGGPKCRSTDPREWGADAIFSIENRQLRFRSYYKLPAAQTPQENCVAHNGSMIPIPGRDVMVQAWYQGGISVFDWTDPDHPVEIAFHDRGPVDSTEMQMGGSWSAYWYNGVIVSSEIARGLDIFELVASPFISQNEIDAANSVRLDYLNAQGQPRYVWPATFALARAYVDQLERSNGLTAGQVAVARRQLGRAEGAAGAVRRGHLTGLADHLDIDAGRSRDPAKVRVLAGAVRELAARP